MASPLASAHATHRQASAARFAELQQRLVTIHAATGANRAGRSIVVVPSRTIDKGHEDPAATQAYEERLLCLLLALRDPGLSVIYVTSSAVAPAIVDYYLSLLPQPLRWSARARLTLLSARDPSQRPLAEKMLERPRLLRAIRWAVPDADLCQLVPYSTTELERDLALALDIPMYGPDPRHSHFGTKSGARELFARAGVPHPLGVERIAGVHDAIDAIAGLRAARPDLAELVIKLDEGVGGNGNAIVDVGRLPRPGDADEPKLIAERLERMSLEATGVSVEAYLSKLAARGGIVEERITGRELRSPSVQLDVTPAGEVVIVSTHDQLLGGHNGHSYLGCRFPADPAYVRAITEQAAKVGRALADAGVIGRSAIDFVAVRDGGGEWHPHAIELNLRRGGTTHPLATLEHLTAGAYDADSATFTTAAGAQKHYVASDHIESPSLRRVGQGGVLELLNHRLLGFDHARLRGVVFHMLSSLDGLGRVGLTAVGDSADDAQLRFEHARAVLLEAAARPAIAAQPRPARLPLAAVA